MSDLSKSEKSAAYERYESLLIQRDSLRKAAGSCLTAYLREFGELITKVFRKKVDCIRKKKSIAFCQAAANRGGMIHIGELRKHLDETMEAYSRQLARMTKEYQTAQKAKSVTEHTLIRLKSIYRRIAKLIHPDTHPQVWNCPEIAELWNRVTSAYGSNDLEELQSLEVLIHKAMDDNGFVSGAVEIPEIDGKIHALEAEIEKIISTDPYQYRNLLDDPEAVAEKKRNLEEEYASYERYETELNEVLKGFLKNGVIVEWQEN